MGSKKKRGGVVYSTNEDYNVNDSSGNDELTLPPEEQLLYISLDSKQRKGKVVTLIEGFQGSSDDLKDLEKFLKNRCGVGGSSKDGVIILQGPLKQKVGDMLAGKGYHIKLKG